MRLEEVLQLSPEEQVKRVRSKKSGTEMQKYGDLFIIPVKFKKDSVANWTIGKKLSQFQNLRGRVVLNDRNENYYFHLDESTIYEVRISPASNDVKGEVSLYSIVFGILGEETQASYQFKQFDALLTVGKIIGLHMHTTGGDKAIYTFYGHEDPRDYRIGTSRRALIYNAMAKKAGMHVYPSSIQNEFYITKLKPEEVKDLDLGVIYSIKPQSVEQPKAPRMQTMTPRQINALGAELGYSPFSREQIRMIQKFMDQHSMTRLRSKHDLEDLIDNEMPEEFKKAV